MDDESSHGVPEWVVTYGDMMSLLLTFFIMLVSLSDVVAEEKYLAILDSLQRYVGYQTGPAAPPGKSFPLDSMLVGLETLGSFTDEDTGYGGVRQSSVEGTELKVYRTREGDSRLAGRPVPFERSKAGLTPEAEAELVAIAAELAGKPNKVVIRGHTSTANLPLDSPYADKMALTYERARNVYDWLVAKGIDYKRLRIEAMSDSAPLPRRGDRRTFQPERVEVILLNAFADEFIGPREVPK